MADTPSSKLLLAAAAGAVTAAAATAMMRRCRPKAGAILEAGAPPTGLAPFASETLANAACPMPGTMVLCVQNLAVSGANQVLLNLAEGCVWNGNIVLLSPSVGPFAKEFADLGVAVHIGELDELLAKVRDVRIAICNTIMTAHLVCALDARCIPQLWVLHEWWPGDMLVEELAKRNDKNTTPAVVNKALAVCKRTICVCRSQLELYKPANGVPIFVGVPSPSAVWKVGAPPAESRPLTFLCLGIVCPRKNQHFAVELFKEWAGSRKDVRLLVVGARYVRQYEIDYVNKVKAAAGGDSRIEIHDVTNDVDAFYRQSDVLLFTSLNEVTPMVIAESMMRSMPVITTNIAGIPEMFTHAVHGFCYAPEERQGFIDALTELGATDADGQRRRLQMGAAAKRHATDTFTNAHMVAQYRAIALELSPPVVLLDMDGVLVDWDRGFARAWGGRSKIGRDDYAMERCVPEALGEAAKAVFHAERFFAELPPMPGAVAAVKEMASRGYHVLFCTSPVLTSSSCPSEKFEWVRRHFGPGWVSRIVLTSDKTVVRGDILIDDKPKIVGCQTPAWRQLLFDAPYNRHLSDAHRLSSWSDWEPKLLELLTHLPGPAAPAEDDSSAITKEAIMQLPDFSAILPPDYRKKYAAWRQGEAHGAKGELMDAVEQMAQMQDLMANNSSEDFTEISVFRNGYSNWRRGGVTGAKGTMAALFN